MHTYKDYRADIRAILDNIDNSQAALTLGALSITTLLNAYKQDDVPKSVETPTTTPIATPEPKQQPYQSTVSDPPITARLSDTPSDLTTASLATISKLQTPVPHKVPEPVKKPAEREYEPNQMRVKRLLNGFKLVDPVSGYDGRHYHYNELAARELNVTNDDLVEVEPYHNPQDSRPPYIQRIIEHNYDPDNIVTGKYFVVEYDDQAEHFHVRRDYHGNELSAINTRVGDFYIETDWVSGKQIQAGTLVDLAWYRANPAKLSIRFVHPEEPMPAAVEKPEPKPITNTAKSTSVQTTDTEVPTSTPEIATLKYNLRGKTVAIVIGDAMRETELKQLLKEHNGRLFLIDAFKHANSSTFYDHQLKNGVDYIVMVQNQNKHATSKALNKAAKKYNINMAIADGGGIQQIERAIYRAQNNLPAYESNIDIDYPTK